MSITHLGVHLHSHFINAEANSESLNTSLERLIKWCWDPSYLSLWTLCFGLNQGSACSFYIVYRWCWTFWNFFFPEYQPTPLKNSKSRLLYPLCFKSIVIFLWKHMSHNRIELILPCALLVWTSIQMYLWIDWVAFVWHLLNALLSLRWEFKTCSHLWLMTPVTATNCCFLAPR